MKITFYSDNVFEDFTNWALEDKKLYKKIASLIKDIKRNPHEGIGKPEPLKHDLSGLWSRRIDDKHRLVYQMSEDRETLIIVACKNHYVELEKPDPMNNNSSDRL